MNDYAVIYTWRLHPGMDEQFVDGWSRVTQAILRECGSFGSRLHLTDDGWWLAYARWPDAATRQRCFDRREIDPVGSTMMANAIAERRPETVMNMKVDMLTREPTP